MTALVCGSYAFDSIMVFPDKFGNHILPEKTQQLNVAFLVPELRREFGGCAGNIAYNLHKIGGDVLPMGTVGSDFASYMDWMATLGINKQYVETIDDAYTAQAYITTDLDDNQITAFHPGAMNYAHQQSVPNNAGITLGLVSPDGRDGMIQHAKEFADLDIPFIFDPGQGLPMFDGDDLKQFIQQATYVAVNDYESAMLEERTGLSAEDIAKQVDAYIITRGAEGSTIYADGGVINIPVVPAPEIKDPTGCGDAFRAGLLYGLMNNLGWEKTGRVASLLGSLKIRCHGTQNHELSPAILAEAYQDAFGKTL